MVCGLFIKVIRQSHRGCLQKCLGSWQIRAQRFAESNGHRCEIGVCSLDRKAVWHSSSFFDQGYASALETMICI